MIVFDLDDTLYKERDFERSGWEAVRAAMPDVPDLKGEWTDEMRQIYRTHKPQISLSEETIKTLETLKTMAIKIGIITDGRSVTQRNKFYALGLEKYVSPENLIISGEIGYDKSTPSGFEEMMRLNPKETKWIYVGDNPAKDFLWANRMGWTTVMLEDTEDRNVHPQSLPEDIGYHPIIKIRSISEIIDLLKKQTSE